MTLASFIRDYGYFAVLIGTFFEGETILILGGLAAQQGHLQLPIVLLLALIGSFSGDQTAYWVGRRFGPRLVAKWPSWQARVERVGAILQRHRVPILLGFRFVYGIRIAGPVAFGMSGVKPRTFMPLNALGALAWSGLIGGLGYVFGTAVTHVLERVQHFQVYFIGGLVVVACAVALTVHFLRRRRARAQAAADLTRAAGIGAVSLDEAAAPSAGSPAPPPASPGTSP